MSGNEFIDNQAAESDDEEKKVKKKRAHDDDEDSETDDHVPDTYEENDGFIVNDDEVEEEYEASSSHKRRREDDDDSENGSAKKKKRLKKKTFRRLKKKNKLDKEVEDLLQTGSDDEGRPPADEEDVHASNARELRSSLFNTEGMDFDEEDAASEQIKQKKRKKKRSGYDDEDDDEMSDFIVRTKKHVQYDEDIFGSGYVDDEMYDDEAMPDRPDTRESLKRIFGPDEIAEQFMTEEDEIIKQTDLPERYQVRGTVRITPEDKTDEMKRHVDQQLIDIASEAEWIFAQAFEEDLQKNSAKEYQSSNVYGRRDFEDEFSYYDRTISQFDGTVDDEARTLREKSVSAIKEVLRLMVVNNYDIPYIAHYKKEHYHPLLNKDHLWTIYEYDEKWCTLQAKKQHVAELYREVTSVPFPLDLYTSLLELATTVEEVEDLASHFQLHIGRQETGRKRRVKKDLYTQAKKTNVKELAAGFGLTPHQYAECLSMSHRVFNVFNPEQLPEDVANQYVGNIYKNGEVVLKAARHILAREIAMEPYLRQKVRYHYNMYAQITVSLTAKGESASNPRVKHYKNIKSNQLSSYSDVDGLIQLMHIFRDERDGLVKLHIELPDDRFNDAIQRELFLSDENSNVARAWNDQRILILEEAKKLLAPAMEQYIRSYYVKKGRALIGRRCSSNLENILTQGPVGHTKDENYNKILTYDLDDEEENPRPSHYRIMSCCVGVDKEMTTFVQLDGDGQLKDVMQWKYSVFGARSAEIRDIVTQQEEDLKTFIETHNPHALAVATSGMPAIRLYQLLNMVVEGLKRRKAIRDTVRVYYVPDDFAKIYEVSPRAQREFPSSANIIKRAISVGRRLNDPLTEISGLFNSNNDLLSYKFHELQDVMPQELLANYLEQCIIKVVNKVGVDINRIANVKNLQSTLRFVSGLGPRKADYIVKSLATKFRGYITRRKTLVETSEKGGMGIGKTVFMNCAAFLRVVPPAGVAHNEFDVMDNTRIHPESYKLAMKMAMDALDIEDDDEEKVQSSVEDAMKAPERLDELDLIAYADELEKRNIGKKHNTLNRIRKELKDPYKDPRNPFIDLSDTSAPDAEYRRDKLFEYITGESNEAFRKGTIVTVMLQRPVEDRGSRNDQDENIPRYHCVLENGLRGIVRDIHTTKEVKSGAILDCQIEDVDRGNFSVLLSCNDAQIEQTKRETMITKESLSSSSSRSRRKKKPLKRNISHPNFKNFNYGEALKYLTDKPYGEAVVRPSSKGSDHLAVTFKFYKDITINLDIQEEDKADLHSLGRKLVVNKRVYSDIDEIVVRYVNEIMDLSKKLFHHPKFTDLPADGVDKQLQAEKQKNPKGIPYRIGLNPKYVGKFLIYYLPSKSVKKQNVTVTPEGYVYNQRTFTSITQLLNAFKKSYSAVHGSKTSSSSSSGASSSRSSTSGTSTGNW
jgi:transcription elongation factor SPT6